MEGKLLECGAFHDDCPQHMPEPHQHPRLPEPCQYPQPGKHGHVGPALRHDLQLERAKKLFSKYNIPLSRFAMPTGIREHAGGSVALVKVGHTSAHSLEEFKNYSGRHECWERKQLISQEQMEAGVATELLQPRLFKVLPLAISSRHHLGVSAFSGARSNWQIFLLGWMLILCIALTNFSWSTRPVLSRLAKENKGIHAQIVDNDLWIQYLFSSTNSQYHLPFWHDHA